MSGEMKQEVISPDGSLPDAHLDNEGKFYLSYKSDSAFYENHKSTRSYSFGDDDRLPKYNGIKIPPDEKVFIIDGVQEIGNVSNNGFEVIMKRGRKVYSVAKYPSHYGYIGYHKIDGEYYPEAILCSIL